MWYACWQCFTQSHTQEFSVKDEILVNSKALCKQQFLYSMNFAKNTQNNKKKL